MESNEDRTVPTDCASIDTADGANALNELLDAERDYLGKLRAAAAQAAPEARDRFKGWLTVPS